LLTEEFTIDSYRKRYGDAGLPILLIGPKAEVRIFAEDQPPIPAKGWTLISLVPPNGTENDAPS